VNGDRPLGRQIVAITGAETGASFEELADRTGASYAEVKAAVWRLYGAKRADICQGYVVAIPRAAAAEGVPAA
jgi:hypothetical protein